SFNTVRPRRRVAGCFSPISADVFFIERPDQRRGPGGGVNAVCYRSNGHVTHAASGTHLLPELEGDFAMLPADPVRRSALAQRQGRQAKAFARIAVHSTQRKKLFA